MLRIALDALRFRTTAFVAGVIAMFVAAAIVMACGGLFNELTLLVGFAALSVVNSLVAATTRGPREFGLLRVSGATRSQVLRSISVEGPLVALIGIELGSIASIATVVQFALVKHGSPIPSEPLWINFAVTGSVTVVTLAASICLPGTSRGSGR
jgi:ABC-type antimicrobial peptide transport system permease subunit